MNRALDIKNWRNGGNSYILKGNPKNKWVGFQDAVLADLHKAFGDNFNIIIWTDEKLEDDYYCIPFSVVKHLFVDEHKTTGKYPGRWTAIILDHQFMMHSNSQLAVNIAPYYASPLFSYPNITVDEDFYIENAKAEINIRLGQSKFRQGVLRNFGNKCALTGITEASLLTASHIIPWSHKKEYRADISNGICLYVEHDMLFDKGFISFTDDLNTIVTAKEPISNNLRCRLEALRGTKMAKPLNKDLNRQYLEYHRRNIFQRDE